MSTVPAFALAAPAATAPTLTLGYVVKQISGARAFKFMLPYFIGAQFGAVVGTAILEAPLSVETAIDLAVTMLILLMFCWFMDLSKKLRRKSMAKSAVFS